MKSGALAPLNEQLPDVLGLQEGGRVPAGILAPTATVAAMESETDWEVHRAGVVRDFNAEGTLEVTLAERIALLLWRLARVSRYEREMLAIRQETVEEDLAEKRKHDLYRREPTSVHPDDVRGDVAFHQGCLRLLKRFPKLASSAPVTGEDADTILDAIARSAAVDLRELPLPFVGLDDAIEEVRDWTAGRVRDCIETIAAVNPDDPKELLELAVEREQRELRMAQSELMRVERSLHRMRRERLLGDCVSLETIRREEAHLSRELSAAISQLKNLQRSRTAVLTSSLRPPLHWNPERL